jgi:hypothetical protein
VAEDLFYMWRQLITKDKLSDMKKVMMIAAVTALLTACGGANDGDATTDTTAMPMEPPITDSNSSTGSYPYDSLQDTTDPLRSSPTSPNSRNTTPGGSRNQNDTTRQ